jgi:hypothetical protein
MQVADDGTAITLLNSLRQFLDRLANGIFSRWCLSAAGKP